VAKKRKIYSGAIDTLLENSEMTVKEFEAIIGIYREWIEINFLIFTIIFRDIKKIKIYLDSVEQRL